MCRDVNWSNPKDMITWILSMLFMLKYKVTSNFEAASIYFMKASLSIKIQLTRILDKTWLNEALATSYNL